MSNCTMYMYVFHVNLVKSIYKYDFGFSNIFLVSYVLQGSIYFIKKYIYNLKLY